MIMYKRSLSAGLPCLFVAIQLAATAAHASGDVEYGAYLSSECVTCHQSKDTDAQIPVINGMDAEGFVSIMELYRSEELENPTMRTIAKRLTDEDIDALAAYFASQPAPE